MSVTVLSILNPKIFYQFLLSVEFSNFGKHTEECQTHEEECDVSQLNYAYYYLALIVFLTLGRSNRISFLWRTMAEILNMLNEMHKKHQSKLRRIQLDIDEQEIRVSSRKTTESISVADYNHDIEAPHNYKDSQAGSAKSMINDDYMFVTMDHGQNIKHTPNQRYGYGTENQENQEIQEKENARAQTGDDEDVQPRSTYIS